MSGFAPTHTPCYNTCLGWIQEHIKRKKNNPKTSMRNLSGLSQRPFFCLVFQTPDHELTHLLSSFFLEPGIPSSSGCFARCLTLEHHQRFPLPLPCPCTALCHWSIAQTCTPCYPSPKTLRGSPPMLLTPCHLLPWFWHRKEGEGEDGEREKTFLQQFSHSRPTHNMQPHVGPAQRQSSSRGWWRGGGCSI